jgi:hypothetical protein
MVPKITLSRSPSPVATKPGCKQFAVTPVPAEPREFAREQDIGEKQKHRVLNGWPNPNGDRFSVCPHKASKAVCGLSD